MSKKKKLAAAAPVAAKVADEVSDTVKGRKGKKKKRLGFGRLVTLALVGGIGAMIVSEPLRSKVLDLLFGAEEEFQYTPPVTTAPPPPSVGSTPSAGAA